MTTFVERHTFNPMAQSSVEHAFAATVAAEPSSSPDVTQQDTQAALGPSVTYVQSAMRTTLSL